MQEAMQDTDESDTTRPLLVAAARYNSASVSFTVDGRRVTGHAGQSILSAILLAGDRLRVNEFSGEPRAGFCLMGACQDCWVWLDGGARLRACTTPVAEGLAVRTMPPAGFPRHD